MPVEAKLFGVVLSVCLLLAGIILSFHEGEDFQGNKDKVVAQAMQIAAQKALDEANKLANEKERAMQADMDKIGENAQQIAKENDEARTAIAQYQSGQRKLYIRLAACNKPMPSTTANSSKLDDSSLVLVPRQISADLESARREHNALVLQLQELQNANRILEGKPQVPIIPPPDDILQVQIPN